MQKMGFHGEVSPRVNRLICLLFLSVFSLYFLHKKLGLIPRSVTWIPELLAISALLVFVLHAAINRQYYMHPKYFGLIGLFLLVIFTGMILNGTSAVSAIAGLRFYLKHFPFFLLPAVWAFSDKALMRQLSFLLPILLLQFPIAVFQRIYYSRWRTGDVVTGTLATSSELSIVMICAMAVAFAFYLRHKISPRQFLLLAFCLFVPTIINETKATLILLPLAFFVPIILTRYSSPALRKKNILTMALIGILFITAFVPLYDTFYGDKFNGIIAFFSNSNDSLKNYLYRERTEADLKAGKYLPRGDALMLGFRKMAEDPIHFIFGLGAGNIINSFLRGDSEQSSFVKLYGIQQLAVTNLLWELGLAGVLIYYWFLYAIFKDVILLRHQPGAIGTFALGWCAVVAIMCFCLIYKNVLYLDVTNFIFWYFSGLMASAAFRQKLVTRDHSPAGAMISPAGRVSGAP